MTVPSILTTARSLAFYSRQQEVVANNLANASSEGFKADRMTAQSFDQVWPEALMSLDLRQGTVRDTARPWDLALESEGFLVVNTPDGERLTRGGGFEVDQAGFLVDRDGNQLLGREGPIHISGETVVVEQDGTVIVDDARAGQLRVETVADPSRLVKEGHGRFRAEDPLLAVEQPRIRQGAIEDANVDALTGTVDLIRIQRAYAAGVDALRTLDGVMSVITDDVGRV
ncbi:MAG: flagellar hook-basal body complex protein [Gemmatimonadetes bacterium]|nr:flagellar hook-basal body complex protein [Gemmatimonadota bacterium]MCA9763191.1 flagellar hook-basal body complex protein [Gemmatimonadota bacterium]MCB9518840.1 flagellar hook-basal body complex protein [Gemmatimonadales bacterium]HPF62191.1 flagellar hook-basal body complex protein [Gemmatimonadales bacterium]HRX19704.1 flagellar hook-basal body complex protein [Gemmatimonadales bacterium]